MSGGAAGGGLMTFETVKIPMDSKAVSVQGTGLMRESMKESLSVVTSWLRANAQSERLKNTEMEKYQLHVDAVMDGPKDGPSAGIAITTACVSALTNLPVPADIAMTGKMSLGGRVLAIGGVTEKLEGALRNGMTTVLIPHDNLPDTEDLRDEIKQKIKIVPVKTINDVLSYVFNKHACGLDLQDAANDNAHAELLQARGLQPSLR